MPNMSVSWIFYLFFRPIHPDVCQAAMPVEHHTGTLPFLLRPHLFLTLFFLFPLIPPCSIWCLETWPASFLHLQLGVSVQDLLIMLLSHQPTGLHSDYPHPRPSLASLVFLILDWPLPLILYWQPVGLFYCANSNTHSPTWKSLMAPTDPANSRILLLIEALGDPPQLDTVAFV